MQFGRLGSQFVVITAICISGACAQQQEAQRPKPGSIRFGAERPPIEWRERDIGAFRDVFVRVSQSVIPAVVSVIPTRVDTIVFPRNPFYRFFEEDPWGRQPQLERRERRQQGLGSGFVVSRQGYILTNYHVVAGAEEIRIQLADRRTFSAMVAGTDSLSDVAVLKIEGNVPSDLPVVFLGNSDTLKPGSWVTAVGNPYSLTSTVTAGIVSALGRRITREIPYQDFIQTDAAVNPGNSGGPLVDINGAVMGINTLIFSQTGGFMGIGFAIPINLARRIMEDLIYRGEVVRGWIGITVQELDEAGRKALGIAETQGALVSDFVEDGPAQKAGLRRGDVIVSIAGEEILGTSDLLNIVASLRPGATVPVTVIRNGREQKLRIQVAERTEKAVQRQAPQSQPRKLEDPIGFGVGNLTPELRDNLNIARSVQGVVVEQVPSGLMDSRALVRPGDVITRIKVEGRDWVEIRSVADYNRFSAQLKSGQSVILMILRGTNTLLVPFSVG